VKSNNKTLAICCVGGVLEFYDFIIYALMASYLAQLFFPLQDKLSSLLATFATFSVGYLVRPIGGIIFGHYGDRFGRKNSFSASVLLMAFSTFAIGCLPTYDRWGIAAPLCLTLLRMAQGVSVGGEIPGALTYISESMPDRRFFYSAIVFAGVMCGLILGSLMNAALTQILSADQMKLWGWRIPFFAGGLFGLFSYYLRKHLEETQDFKLVVGQVKRVPVWSALTEHGQNILAAFFLVGFAGTTTVLYFLFTPAFIGVILQYPLGHFLWFKMAATVLAALVCVWSGSINRNGLGIFVIQVFLLMACLLSFLVFYLYVYHFDWMLLALLLSGIANGLIWGRLPGLLGMLFSTETRYSGVALAYNLGFGVLAGVTPLVATALIGWTGQLLSPLYYLTAQALCALLAVLWIKAAP
jgi:MFS family permease